MNSRAHTHAARALQETPPEPVFFRLGEATVSFPGPQAFECWVRDKTQPSADAWVESVASSNAALVAQCWRDGQTLNLTELLEGKEGSDCARATARVFALLRLDGIANDHRWPEILGALAALPEGLEAYRRVGLRHYLRYLECRRDAVLGLLQDRRQGLRMPSRRPAQSDITQLDGAAAGRCVPVEERTCFEALIPGRPVVVADLGAASLPLRLGTSEFRLVAGDSSLLVVAPNGLRHRLREGRNLIGRARYNDVVVSPEFKTVSRRHLLVEIRAHRVCSLTDLSSTGTAVPCALLGHAGRRS